MRHLLGYAVVGCTFFVSGLLAQDDIQRGKVKKVDADKGVITITVDGKARDFTVAENTRIVDTENRPAKDGFKHEGFKPGAAVMFRAVEKDGKAVLVGLKLAGNAQPNPAGQAPPPVDLAKFKPLTDMAPDE